MGTRPHSFTSENICFRIFDTVHMQCVQCTNLIYLTISFILSTVRLAFVTLGSLKKVSISYRTEKDHSVEIYLGINLQRLLRQEKLFCLFYEGCFISKSKSKRVLSRNLGLWDMVSNTPLVQSYKLTFAPWAQKEKNFKDKYVIQNRKMGSCGSYTTVEKYK